MSRGPGWVQRAVADFLTHAITTHDYDFRITLDDIARAVYSLSAKDKVTASHRTAVWRGIRIPNGPIPGCPGWYIVRLKTWRRQWEFLAPQASSTADTPPSRPSAGRDGALAGCIRLLGSSSPGEKDAALLAADRMLMARNKTWHDVARVVAERL